MANRILIVEDSPTMKQLLTFTLKRLAGVEIVDASDGVEALRKVTGEKFDLILTDINMPMMDGLKFVDIVRQNSSNENKNTPIIIITTEGGEKERDKGIALGANSYITKPINAIELMRTVKQFLNIS